MTAEDTITLEDGSVIALPAADEILGYGKLATWEGQDLDLCRLMFADEMWHLFPSCCKIMNEQTGTVTFLDPTPAQKLALDVYKNDRWAIVSKYRQAKMTTLTEMLLLRDCMLIEGTNGILIGNKGRTSEEVFRRITYAYKEMAKDPELRGMVAPLDPDRKARATALFFAHGGSIQLMSAAEASAGVGFSIDRMLFTEVGEVDNLEEVNMQLFPGLWKRPTARVWLESTPGKMGTEHEHLWLDSYHGKTRFAALFLEWWKDDSCWKDPEGFEPTDDEIEYMAKHDGMDLGNLAYRREAINTIYSRSESRFAAKHPSHYRDGWLGGDAPTLPTDALLELRETAVDDPKTRLKAGVGVIKEPIFGRQYAVIVDPGRFGEEGDVSAVTVFDLWDNEEVAVWEDREQPTDVADRTEAASNYYNNALIVVESNAEGVVTALVDRGYSNRMFWSKRRSPGWYASTLVIQQGETRLIEMINAETIKLNSRATIEQLIVYSPAARKRRARHSEGTTRHFDRARTIVMYADVRHRIPVSPPKAPPKSQEKTKREDGVIVVSFADDFDQKKRGVGRGSPYNRSR